MSAVGTTLLHSPGRNEGKARYETLGKHQKRTMRPARAALLHSPGWNEGEARYETLGTRR